MALNHHWHVHTMDDLFDLQRGSKWSLKTFCDNLHEVHSQSSLYGVASVQLRRLSFQKSFFILDVVPIHPRSYDPQPNAIHTYIEIRRSESYNDYSVLNILGVCGPASDSVIVLRQEDEAGVTEDSGPGDHSEQTRNAYRGSEHLVTLDWSYRLPRLLDVLSQVTLLSVTYPRYNIFTRRCSWLAHAICVILGLAQRCGAMSVLDRRYEFRFKRAIFWLFAEFHPPIDPGIIEFWWRKDKWRQLAVERPKTLAD